MRNVSYWISDLPFSDFEFFLDLKFEILDLKFLYSIGRRLICFDQPERIFQCFYRDEDITLFLLRGC